MKYDPERHHRRSIRLSGWDYTSAGAYFVTICTHERSRLFGKVVDGQMQMNEYGQIVWACWKEIPLHFPHVELDAFVVMPNHVHGIIILAPVGARHKVGAPHAVPPPFGKPVPGSIPTILRSFKSAVTKRINALREVPGAPVWQSNYYEHIIRYEREWGHIREYILNNPARWETNENNPDFPSLWRVRQR
jgi:putative transposase